MRTLACIGSVKLYEVELFALFFEAVGLRPFVTSKKIFSKYVASFACMYVCPQKLSAR